MKVLIPADRIQVRIAELAEQIAGDYGEGPFTIIGVLTGSLIFLADLVRILNLPIRIGLLQASSYRGPTTTPGAARASVRRLLPISPAGMCFCSTISSTQVGRSASS